MSRIILVGPAAAGKDFIKRKFLDKGFLVDVSFTTRLPRENEKHGEDYVFMSVEGFELMKKANGFYEWAQHGGHFYGTGIYEWKHYHVFIMETEGISKITLQDRAECVIIYVNTPFETRLKRLREREWTDEIIQDRLATDEKKFKDFTDYDFTISSE